MIKILALAESGFGKTTSLLKNEKLGIKGIDPKETFMISCVAKWTPNYKVTTLDKLKDGNRLISSDATLIVPTLKALGSSPYNIIVIDDMNYIMQDYYMANAKKNGWDTPKEIGYNMGLIFSELDKLAQTKIVICLAHYEDYKANNAGDISYRMKTTGKMTSEYLTPEGKFDIVLYGKSSYDDSNKKINKVYVTENDGQYPAKCQGLFDDLYIPNDMGLIVNAVRNYGK